MKTINFLKSNLINLIGTALLLSAVLSIVICFTYAAVTESNLIAHFSLNN